MTARSRRLASSLLLAGGIVLVFAGLSAALGFTPLGMLASVGAIAALLYAGATWFAEPARLPPVSNVLVFDHTLTLTSGQPLLARFAEAEHAELRARCASALAGERVSATIDGRGYDITPIVSGEGVVLFGALIERGGPLLRT